MTRATRHPVPTITLDGTDCLDWLPEELAAFELPELLSTADWVERHVSIPSEGNALPGRIDLELTPYLRGMFDAVEDPAIDTITAVTGTQIGKTTFVYGTMMALSCQRPGPQLLVMPREPDAREVAGKQLKAHVLACEPMHRNIPNENLLTKEGYTLLTGSWYFGSAEAGASLGRRPIRHVFYDEVEKFPPYLKREADALQLGDGRLRTYRNTLGSLSVRVSSPGDETSLIHKSWLASDQREYWVPCPQCGAYQVLTWQSVRWARDDQGNSLPPEQIRDDALAWIECLDCSHPWTEPERLASIRRGVWAARGQTVDRLGRVYGEPEKPRSRHAGFHVSALYSSFTTVAELAFTFLRAKAEQDISALKSFVQQQLGEPWVESETELEESALKQRAEPYPLQHAPEGVQAVVVGVDVQRGYYVLEARGWGYAMESWLLDARAIQTDEELEVYLRDQQFPRCTAEGQALDPADHPPLPILGALIDAGDDTTRIYELCDRLRASGLNVSPSMGTDHMRTAYKVVARPRTKNPRSKRRFRSGSLMLYEFENLHWKTLQAMYAGSEEPGPGYFHLPRGLPEEWYRQFLSERLVTDRSRYSRGRSGRPTKRWVTKGAHTANHYWDCAILCCVATDPAVYRLRQLQPPSEQGPSQARPRRRVGRMNVGR